MMTDSLGAEPTTAVPFASLATWLRDHHFMLTDRQTCYRLCEFLFTHARRAGVDEDQIAHLLHAIYHPRATRPQTR